MDETERLLKSFIKSLNDFKAALDKYAEAVYKDQDAGQNSNRPQIQGVIRSEVSLPPAVQAYYEAEEIERPSKNKWERIKRVIEVVAFFAAIVAAFFTYKTLHQTVRQADNAQAQVTIMRQQLEAADRP